MPSPARYHVYSLPTELLDTLVYRTPFTGLEAATDQFPEQTSSTAQPTDPIFRSCNTCLDAVFADVEQQRVHFRSDWHRYNVNMRLNGGNIVDEAEYLRLVDGMSSDLPILLKFN
jgi:hypothetical protein